MFADNARHAVALATVADLPSEARRDAGAEYMVSRIAAQRAIRAIVGDQATIEVQRRANRAPIARVRDGDAPTRRVALSLTHRDVRMR